MIHRDNATSYWTINTPHYNLLFFLAIITIFHHLEPAGRNRLAIQATRCIWQINMIVTSQRWCMTGLIFFCVFRGPKTRLLILSQPSYCWNWEMIYDRKDSLSWSLVVRKLCSSVIFYGRCRQGWSTTGTQKWVFFKGTISELVPKLLLWDFGFHVFEFRYLLEHVNMDEYYIVLQCV